MRISPAWHTDGLSVAPQYTFWAIRQHEVVITATAYMVLPFDNLTLLLAFARDNSTQDADKQKAETQDRDEVTALKALDKLLKRYDRRSTPTNDLLGKLGHSSWQFFCERLMGEDDCLQWSKRWILFWNSFLRRGGVSCFFCIVQVENNDFLRSSCLLSRMYETVSA